MAAVKRAVTRSATRRGGRARQLSRRVGGSVVRHPRRHASVTEAASAATLTARTVTVDVPHIAGWTMATSTHLCGARCWGFCSLGAARLRRKSTRTRTPSRAVRGCPRTVARRSKAGAQPVSA